MAPDTNKEGGAKNKVENLLRQLTQQQSQLLDTYKSFLENLSLETSLQDAREHAEMLKLAGSQLINVQKKELIQMLTMLHPMFKVVQNMHAQEADDNIDFISNAENLQGHHIVELSCLLKCYLAKLALQLYRAAAATSAKLAAPNAATIGNPNIPSTTISQTMPSKPKLTLGTLQESKVNNLEPNHYYTIPQETPQFNDPCQYTQTPCMVKEGYNEYYTMTSSQMSYGGLPKRGFLAQIMDALCCGTVSRRVPRQATIYHTMPITFVSPNSKHVHPSFNASPTGNLYKSPIETPTMHTASSNHIEFTIRDEEPSPNVQETQSDQETVPSDEDVDKSQEQVSTSVEYKPQENMPENYEPIKLQDALEMTIKDSPSSLQGLNFTPRSSISSESGRVPLIDLSKVVHTEN
ncbi:hypothetical protein BdWA1_000797 [Babesia duncani]|uniref:Uncharacterized protein n=1 Tax=Babesia duncani TaxID=323732 RepID=A0AAD9PN30_9APIC|nr:hypothetical protein BdWA1_000797 [Babesia duncani]